MSNLSSEGALRPRMLEGAREITDLRGDPDELQLGLGRILQVHRRGQRNLSGLVPHRPGLDHRHCHRRLDHRIAAGFGTRRHAHRAEPSGVGHCHRLRGTLS
ncbi:hypothetical protein EMIT053CA3_160028 [Pseudomonas donghuensis]